MSADLHHRDGLLDQLERSEEIDVHDVLPLGDVGRDRHRPVALVVRVLHDDVEPTVVLCRLFHQRRARRRIRDVVRNGTTDAP